MYYKVCTVIHAMPEKKLFFFKATLGFRNPFKIHSTAKAKVLRKIACSNPNHSCLSYGMIKVTQLFRNGDTGTFKNTDVRGDKSAVGPITTYFYIHSQKHTVNLIFSSLKNVPNRISLRFWMSESVNGKRLLTEGCFCTLDLSCVYSPSFFLFLFFFKSRCYRESVLKS